MLFKEYSNFSFYIFCMFSKMYLKCTNIFSKICKFGSADPSLSHEHHYSDL